jgi:hypothetical protein
MTREHNILYRRRLLRTSREPLRWIPITHPRITPEVCFLIIQAQKCACLFPQTARTNVVDMHAAVWHSLGACMHAAVWHSLGACMHAAVWHSLGACMHAAVWHSIGPYECSVQSIYTTADMFRASVRLIFTPNMSRFSSPCTHACICERIDACLAAHQRAHRFNLRSVSDKHRRLVSARTFRDNFLTTLLAHIRPHADSNVPKYICMMYSLDICIMYSLDICMM